MKVLIFLGLLWLFICFSWLVIQNQRNKNFQRFMKPGDGCWWYEGENRIRSTIRYIVSERVIIQTEFGDIEEVNKTDLYV